MNHVIRQVLFLAVTICLFTGCKRLNELAELFEGEKKADVQNKKTLAHTFFSLNYPGNWSLNREDEDFDLNGNIIIESAGDSFVQFFFIRAVSDPEENLKPYREKFSKLISQARVKTFQSWGSFKGHGEAISGRLLGFKVLVRVFSAFTAGRTFIVLEYGLEDDFDLVQPGFKLVETSFKVH